MRGGDSMSRGPKKTAGRPRLTFAAERDRARVGLREMRCCWVVAAVRRNLGDGPARVV